jgi:hypothetical protein
MLQSCGEVDLPLKPLGSVRSGFVGQENLERNRAVVTEILSEVDHGHPAAPDLPEDGIAIGEGLAHPFRDVHASPRDQDENMDR